MKGKTVDETRAVRQTKDSRPPLTSTGLRAAALGGGAARPAPALNVPQKAAQSPYGVSEDSYADRDLPPQPYGLPAICFVPRELTDVQYWRLKHAIADLKADA